MPSPDIRLLLVDVDGCLLPGAARELDYPSFTRIRNYCTGLETTAGPELVLCTGRPQPYVAALLAVLGAVWPHRPSIVEAGAYLYYPAEGRAQPNLVLSPGLLDRWRETKRHLRDQAPAMGARPGLGEKLGLSLIPLEGKVGPLFDHIQKHFAGWDHIEITHSSMCVDIAPKGVNKGTAIRQLAAETSIDPRQMLGIGDSINDLTMLDMVGVPTCPANAHPRVKEKCVYISPFPSTTGVWDIISRYA